MPTKKIKATRPSRPPAATKKSTKPKAASKKSSASSTRKPARPLKKKPATRRRKPAKSPAAPSALEKLVAEGRVLGQKIAQAVS